MKHGLVGRWEGTVTFPSSWLPSSAKVEIEFTADGHYSARCVAPLSPPEATLTACGAFYYGSDADSPLKRYQLNDITANGEGWGDIDIFWEHSGTTRGALEHVALDAAMTTLTFEFWATWSSGRYGPGTYKLTCNGRS